MCDFCVEFLFCGVVFGVFPSFAVILLRKRELVALLQLFCCVLCSVTLPYGAMGWPAVCGCAISGSYPLTF